MAVHVAKALEAGTGAEEVLRGLAMAGAESAAVVVQEGTEGLVEEEVLTADLVVKAAQVVVVVSDRTGASWRCPHPRA